MGEPLEMGKMIINPDVVLLIQFSIHFHLGAALGGHSEQGSAKVNYVWEKLNRNIEPPTKDYFITNACLIITFLLHNYLLF